MPKTRKYYKKGGNKKVKKYKAAELKADKFLLADRIE